jgi:hypothetical protein
MKGSAQSFRECSIRYRRWRDRVDGATHAGGARDVKESSAKVASEIQLIY